MKPKKTRVFNKTSVVRTIKLVMNDSDHAISLIAVELRVPNTLLFPSSIQSYKD